jgi:hypothetical protein
MRLFRKYSRKRSEVYSGIYILMSKNTEHEAGGTYQDRIVLLRKSVRFDDLAEKIATLDSGNAHPVCDSADRAEPLVVRHLVEIERTDPCFGSYQV